MTAMESSSPVRNPETVSSRGGVWPRTLTVTPRGGVPARLTAALTSFATSPSTAP